MELTVIGNLTGKSGASLKTGSFSFPLDPLSLTVHLQAMNSTLEVVNLPPEVINALKRYEMSPLSSNEVILPFPRAIPTEELLPTSEFEKVYGKMVTP